LHLEYADGVRDLLMYRLYTFLLIKLKGVSENSGSDKIRQVLSSVKKKKRSLLPSTIKPMLATLVDEPFDEEGWLYEVKWDGYRALSILNNGEVEILSRNNKSFNEKFYPLESSLRAWEINAVFDGEIVVINKQGMPDFAALQTWRSEADGLLMYYIFDILWLDGFDLMEVPLNERRQILEAIIPENRVVKLSEAFSGSGREFYTHADKMKLEGIIAKRESGTYKPDKRSKDWLKIKTQRFQEAVVGGYTRNENTSKKFSSLLLGIFENDEFISLATVGTGFTVKMQTEIVEKLQPLEIPDCPFREPPEYNKPSRFRPDPPKAEVKWVKPEVVVEISYRTVASDGSFRHPSFKGIREDKDAKDVVRELPGHTADVVDENNVIREKAISKPGKMIRKSLLNPADETQVRNIGGKDLKFTNLSKIFWQDSNITKRDMLNYYYQVVPYILPYMKGRPQTLNRFPNGIHGKSFYQKDVTGKVPGWIDTFSYYSQGDQREKNFLVCSNEESLLYIANLGCIEMNPWSSRAGSPDQPDWCIIDLDPDENTFAQVIEAAQVTKKVLDAIGVDSYCKTSGSTGLHIYIPLKPGYTYEDSKEFGRAIAKVIQAEIPSFTTIERYTSKRKGKMYVDFLQNRPQATVAAPYSIRPKPKATVSMPLHWEEVKKGLKIQDFTIRNAVERIDEQGDIFKNVLTKENDIESAREKLEETFFPLNKKVKKRVRA
jgi:bifunctional non-homologous end joining protein LigD